VPFGKSIGLDDDRRSRFSEIAVAATITTSPRLIARLVVGCVELGYCFDPIQGLILVAPTEDRDLSGHAIPDRQQARIGNHEAKFTQSLSASPLAHRPHSLGRCGHLVTISRRDAVL
jgi:hypothetical protein